MYFSFYLVFVFLYFLIFFSALKSSFYSLKVVLVRTKQTSKKRRDFILACFFLKLLYAREEKKYESTFFDYLVRDSIKLPIFKQKNQAKIVVIKSRSHRSDATELFISRLKNKFKRVEILPVGSSLQLCLVAEGCADLYPRFGPIMEWDIAAGHAIIQNAGGTLVATNNWDILEYNKRDQKKL